MDDPTKTRNENRADRAYRTLLAYGIEGDEGEAVTDLLTDLRHLSDQYGWTLDELTERSRGHYQAEILEANHE
jgi:hypothetical protein